MAEITSVQASRTSVAINKAVEVLLEEKLSLEMQLKEVSAAIDNMRASGARLSGPNDAVSFPSVRPDEFRGLSTIKAFGIYMSARKHLNVPITLSKIAGDLVAGGVDPGSPRGRMNDPFSLVVWSIKIKLPQKGKHESLYTWTPAGKLKGVRPEDIKIGFSDAPARGKKGK